VRGPFTFQSHAFLLISYFEQPPPWRLLAGPALGVASGPQSAESPHKVLPQYLRRKPLVLLVSLLIVFRPQLFLQISSLQRRLLLRFRFPPPRHLSRLSPVAPPYPRHCLPYFLYVLEYLVVPQYSHSPFPRHRNPHGDKIPLSPPSVQVLHL